VGVGFHTDALSGDMEIGDHPLETARKQLSLIFVYLVFFVVTCVASYRHRHSESNGAKLRRLVVMRDQANYFA